MSTIETKNTKSKTKSRDFKARSLRISLKLLVISIRILELYTNSLKLHFYRLPPRALDCLTRVNRSSLFSLKIISTLLCNMLDSLTTEYSRLMSL